MIALRLDSLRCQLKIDFFRSKFKSKRLHINQLNLFQFKDFFIFVIAGERRGNILSSKQVGMKRNYGKTEMNSKQEFFLSDYKPNTSFLGIKLDLFRF